MACIHCGSSNYRKNGKYKGVQRFKCRDCGRYFREKPKKYTYADKVRAIEFYLNNGGLKRTAKFIGCSNEMILQWMQEFADTLRGRLQKVSEKFNEKNLSVLMEIEEIGARVKKAEWAQYGMLVVDNRVYVLHLPTQSNVYKG